MPVNLINYGVSHVYFKVFLHFFCFVPMFVSTATHSNSDCKNFYFGIELKLTEASGIEASSVYPDRLYHINDSGHKGTFTYTDTFLGNPHQIFVPGMDPVDTEDLSIMSCPDKKSSCLFIADIGDNRRERKQIKVTLIKEEESYPVKYVFRMWKRVPVATVYKQVTLKYADSKAHNAEAFAVHPNGDFFIISKISGTATIYQAKFEDWQDGEALMIPVGEIDLANLTKYNGEIVPFVTSMDISNDGTRFLVLTYSKVIEFFYDLTSLSLPDTSYMNEGVDFVIRSTLPLAYQEAVSYSSLENGFIYSTEKKKHMPQKMLVCQSISDS